VWSHSSYLLGLWTTIFVCAAGYDTVLQHHLQLQIYNGIIFVRHHESKILYMITYKSRNGMKATWAFGVCWTTFFEPLTPIGWPDSSDMMLSIHHKTNSPKASGDLWLIQSLAVLQTGSGTWFKGTCHIHQPIRPITEKTQKCKARPSLIINLLIDIR
jgi:hypothetical protein